MVDSSEALKQLQDWGGTPPNSKFVCSNSKSDAGVMAEFFSEVMPESLHATGEHLARARGPKGLHTHDINQSCTGEQGAEGRRSDDIDRTQLPKCGRHESYAAPC